MKNCLQIFWERPRKIRTLGGGVYHAEFSNLSAAKKMMALHMRELEGCPRPLLVSILEQPLPILELFEVLNDKLAGKERAEMYNSPNERPQREVKVQIPPQRNGIRGGSDRISSSHNSPASTSPRHVSFDHSSSSQSSSSGGGGGNSSRNPPEVFYPF